MLTRLQGHIGSIQEVPFTSQRVVSRPLHGALNGDGRGALATVLHICSKQRGSPSPDWWLSHPEQDRIPELHQAPFNDDRTGTGKRSSVKLKL